MKPNWRCHLAVILLIIALVNSIALNFLLFRQGQWYYLMLSSSNLDPLGLSFYPMDDEQSPPHSNQRRVVFLGDSRAADWPAPDLAQFEFVNRGIGNQTSAQVAQRFDYHVKPLQPDIVVVQVGINDLKTLPLFPGQKQSIIAHCKENIQQMAIRSNRLGTTVVLTTIFPAGKVPIERSPFWSDDVRLAVDEVNRYIRSLAGEKVIVFDAFAVLASEGGTIRPEYSQDTLHLNARGYEKLNVELARLLTTLDLR
jgi:lysophospholipase L1-like esterase